MYIVVCVFVRKIHRTQHRVVLMAVMYYTKRIQNKINNKKSYKKGNLAICDSEDSL